MSASRSRCTIRINSLPEETTQESLLLEICDTFGKDTSVDVSQKFSITLTSSMVDNSLLTGIVSCSAAMVKDMLFEKIKGRILNYPPWNSVTVDDEFKGLTILHVPPEAVAADADICFIHGFDSNGIDSFAHESRGGYHPITIWPRDLLPKQEGFENTRILTFGYNAQLSGYHERAKISASGLPINLLKGLELFRDTPEARSVPLILVGYSLGGRVACDAIAELLSSPQKYSNINHTKCGVVFIGTPHQGTSLPKLGKALAMVVARVGPRKTTVRYVQPLDNAAHKKTMSAWQSNQEAENQVLVDAFHETLETKVGISYIMIVDQAFASFIGCTSKTLDRTDHNNLCKFSNKDDANFLLVSGSLHSMVRKLRQRLGGSYV